MKTIPQGAATTPFLDGIGGVYCEDSDIAELASGKGMSAGVKPCSLIENNAKRLWTFTEKMIGATFNAYHQR